MRRLALIALTATLIYPALMILYSVSPFLAVRIYKGIASVARIAGWAGALGFIALAFVYPPFLEKFRLLRKRIWRRAKTDWNEVRLMEKRMAEVPTPGLALKLGHAYFEIEDYSRAAEFYHQAIEQDSEPPTSAFYRMGICLLKRNDAEKALAPLQEVYEREPNHSSHEILLRLGEANRRLGNYAEARKFYETFEERSGAGTPELNYGLGMLEEAEGHRAAARERMKQARESYQKIPLDFRMPHKLHAVNARWFLWTKF
ncbi:MAG: tetratricopeptide repeat protein [Planctomycetota bacterium]|jgi:tetratricopeptide (TPR) repeat protein|nr:tetratricopeptide repeat protein [Planctomycetota bacterium]